MIVLMKYTVRQLLRKVKSCYIRERGVMVAHIAWDDGERFKSYASEFWSGSQMVYDMSLSSLWCWVQFPPRSFKII